MVLLREDEVYVGAKKLLQHLGWAVIAGQPPRGSDHLPVVEIKSPLRTGIGSEGAFKPDLIAHKEGLTVLVECKSAHNEADARKLRLVLGDQGRVLLLHSEIQQRGLFKRRGLDVNRETFARGLRGALAHSGPVIVQPDLMVIAISNLSGGGRLIDAADES